MKKLFISIMAVLQVATLSVLFPINTATVNAAPPADVIMELLFDEPSSATTFFDASPSGNNATCAGTNCPNIFLGRFGMARYFDGNDDYASVSNSASLNPTQAITVEAWIYPVSTNNNHYYEVIATKQYNYELSISVDGRLRVGIINSQNVRVVTNSNPGIVKKGAWNHIALTYDGTNVKGYVNGALAVSKSQNGNIRTNSFPLTIGQVSNSYYYHGSIDELRIRNKALSAQEIESYYRANLGDRLLYMPLDMASSTVSYKDLSFNGNHGSCAIGQCAAPYYIGKKIIKQLILMGLMILSACKIQSA
ncbi:MAG: LamG domain-containing protein [bacterium]